MEEVHIPLNDDCRTEDGKKKIDCEYGYKQGLNKGPSEGYEITRKKTKKFMN